MSEELEYYFLLFKPHIMMRSAEKHYLRNIKLWPIIAYAPYDPNIEVTWYNEVINKSLVKDIVYINRQKYQGKQTNCPRCGCKTYIRDNDFCNANCLDIEEGRVRECLIERVRE